LVSELIASLSTVERIGNRPALIRTLQERVPVRRRSAIAAIGVVNVLVRQMRLCVQRAVTIQRHAHLPDDIWISTGSVKDCLSGGSIERH
jgi:hypothetical protein